MWSSTGGTAVGFSLPKKMSGLIPEKNQAKVQQRFFLLFLIWSESAANWKVGGLMPSSSSPHVEVSVGKVLKPEFCPLKWKLT